MKKVDAALRELGQLYDFEKELAKLRLRHTRPYNQAVAMVRRTAPGGPRPAGFGGGAPRTTLAHPGGGKAQTAGEQ